MDNGLKRSANDPRLMVMSIHPEYVIRILDGSKTVELRRTQPRVLTNQPVAIYATAPISALVATCRVSRLQVSSPDSIWRAVGKASAIEESAYHQYFAGSTKAVALHLTNVRRLVTAVTLAELRARRPFNPPQTWHFVDRSGLRDLVGEHSSSHSLLGMLQPLPESQDASHCGHSLAKHRRRRATVVVACHRDGTT